jgi:hypothetical protein
LPQQIDIFPDAEYNTSNKLRVPMKNQTAKQSFLAVSLSFCFSIPALAQSTLPSGAVFMQTGPHRESHVGYDDAGAAYYAQGAANVRCQSRVAKRISGWSFEHTTSTFPGSCQVIDGRQYCTPDDTVNWSSASAKFRCN